MHTAAGALEACGRLRQLLARLLQVQLQARRLVLVLCNVPHSDSFISFIGAVKWEVGGRLADPVSPSNSCDQDFHQTEAWHTLSVEAKNCCDESLYLPVASSMAGADLVCLAQLGCS